MYRESGHIEQAGLIAAVEQTADGIVITDTGGKIQYVNPAFTVMTGFSVEEAVGQNPRILKSGLERGQPYDLICMDIMMPELDGREAVREIRAMEAARGILSTFGVKIILTTHEAHRSGQTERSCEIIGSCPPLWRTHSCVPHRVSLDALARQSEPRPG